MTHVWPNEKEATVLTATPSHYETLYFLSLLLDKVKTLI